MLHNRFAEIGGELWIDMADDREQAIHVTRNGWKVVAQPPLLFRREPHQLPLLEPERAGSLAELIRYLPPMSEADGLLCCVWEALACVTTITRPILLFVGPHVSGKTEVSRQQKSLIDPSATPLLGEEHHRDLFSALNRHAVPVFDNVPPLRRIVADQFTSGVTGISAAPGASLKGAEGVSTSVHRAMIMNGTQTPSTQLGFLDRVLTIKLRPFDSFRSEKALQAEFAIAAPRLLGGVLNALSGCLRVLNTIPEPHAFRLTDFAWLGRAVAVALGREAGAFDAAYSAALLRQSGDVVEADRVALAVIQYAQRHQQNLGLTLEARDFFEALKAISRELKLDAAGWPGGDSALSGRLREVAPMLLPLGYRLTKLKRTGEYRSRWRLEKVTPDDATVTPPPEPRQAEDDAD